MVAVPLSKGINVDQATNDGSPLYRATRNDHVAVVDVLLSKGANVNQTKYDRQKPIDVAKTQEI